MAVAIVDTGGYLVYFERMPDTQLGSVEVSMDKAKSAALFRRPTKAFQDTLAAGGDGLRILSLHGAIPVEGGIPLIRGRESDRSHRRLRRHQRPGWPHRASRSRRSEIGYARAFP